MMIKNAPNSNLLNRVGELFKASTEVEIPDLYPYRLRTPLLPSVDTAFYQVLLAAVGKRVVICPKIRLADLLQVQVSKEYAKYQTFYKQIASHSIDFLLCERYTLKPLLAIELYDHNQPRATRKRRDPFIDKVFAAAKLPIMHIVAQPEYSLRGLSARIAPYLTTVVYARTPESANVAIPPRCPCCHTPMVRRTVISGDYVGKQYFGCQNYPNCCQRLPLSKSMAYVN